MSIVFFLPRSLVSLVLRFGEGELVADVQVVHKAVVVSDDDVLYPPMAPSGLRLLSLRQTEIAGKRNESRLTTFNHV